jgi:ATP-dependent phosphofructokinase / diphosphate-dependent phosphofructokinase
MRIGVLTGGGDCPGLNAVIRGVVRRGSDAHGFELLGFRYGWAGVLAGDARELTTEATKGILPRGGTILGTSRTNPYKADDGEQRVKDSLERLSVDALIPIGGEDTLGVARRLSAAGVPVIGVPKTIDNDLAGTDYTFGFQTAVQIATEAIDRLHTTAESHNRVLVCEVMGRHAGWIAVHAGIAGGADAILVPERPFDLEEVCSHLRRRHERGRTFSIVVVSEGAVPKEGGAAFSGHESTDAFGHARLGGIGLALEREIEARTGFETRTTILGHTQRGGTPTAYDRVLATRFGVKAADAIAAGESGKMVALRSTQIELVDIDEALAEPKLVDPDLYETAAVFFG